MLTVHDELCFSISNQDDSDKIKDIMSNCISDLKIPFEVDAEMGQNWGEVGQWRLQKRTKENVFLGVIIPEGDCFASL